MRARHCLIIALVTLSILVAGCGSADPGPATGTPVASPTPAPPEAAALPPTDTPPAIDTPAPTDTPVATDIPIPDEPNVRVPRGQSPTIDGTFSADEWASARQEALSDGSELYLVHDREYVYLGLRSSARGNGVVSICLDRGQEVAVLHSSAALGTALYEPDGEEWQQTRPFAWQCRRTDNSTAAQQERDRYLEQEGWVANNGNMGTPEEVEYQIAMPEGGLRLAVTYLGPPNFNSVAAWPASLNDGCRSRQLITGPIPQRRAFAPGTWMTLQASP
jgi:hypothetical protein